jgi:hypothetical protein
VENQPEIALDPDRNPLANAPEFLNDATLSVSNRRIDGTQQKGISQADAGERLSEDAGLQCVDIGDDVGQLRHE